MKGSEIRTHDLRHQITSYRQPLQARIGTGNAFRQAAALPLSYPLRVGSEVYTGRPDPLSSSHAPEIRIASGAIKPASWVALRTLRYQRAPRYVRSPGFRSCASNQAPVGPQASTFCLALSAYTPFRALEKKSLVFECEQKGRGSAHLQSSHSGVFMFKCLP